MAVLSTHRSSGPAISMINLFPYDEAAPWGLHIGKSASTN